VVDEEFRADHPVPTALSRLAFLLDFLENIYPYKSMLLLPVSHALSLARPFCQVLLKQFKQEGIVPENKL
jgi:hypothetical protein